MTIIVYRDGLIASDSDIFSGPDDCIYRVGSANKLIRLKNGVAAECGEAGASEAAINWIRSGFKGQRPDTHGGGVIWFPDRAEPVVIMDSGSFTINSKDFHAWGSGEQFALAAMWMGADAKKAVEAAIHFCVTCGGDVHTMEHVR